MLPSEWAARNPRALSDGLDNAIRIAWRQMHKARRDAAATMADGWIRQNALAHAESERNALRYLLDIRKGAI